MVVAVWDFTHHFFLSDALLQALMQVHAARGCPSEGHVAAGMGENEGTTHLPVRTQMLSAMLYAMHMSSATSDSLHSLNTQETNAYAAAETGDPQSQPSFALQAGDRSVLKGPRCAVLMSGLTYCP
jgi:hypothetical protein